MSSIDQHREMPEPEFQEQQTSNFDQVLESLYLARLKFLIRVGLFGTLGYSCQAIVSLHLKRMTLDFVSISLYLAAWYFARSPQRLNLARRLFFTALSISMFIGPMLAGNFKSDAAWLYGILPLCAAHLYGPRRVLPSAIATLAGLFFHYQIAPLVDVGQELHVVGAMHTSMVCMSVVFFSAIAISSSRMLEKQGTQLRSASVDLIESQAIVDAESHSKGVFMANMSHEIRTPMNGILGMLEDLQQRSVKGEYQSLIETAKESGNRLLDALNNILDVSKIEAQKLSLVDASFCPDRIFSRVEQELGPAAQRRGLRLAFDVPSNWPAVTGDQARLYQILAIIVDNAIRYSDQGTIKISARHSQDAQAELCEIEFEVQDQGAGISIDAQQRIFSGFETMDDLSDQRSGIGLGLALARNLALLMDGDIGVSSELGQGSCFRARVRLPIDQATRADQRTPPPNTSHFELRVLLVDDDPINRRVTSLQLQRLGCEVAQAASGTTAIQLASETDYDLVFMDLQMPDMSGYTAATKILAAKTSTPPPRIIAFSSDANPQSLAEAKKAGMIDYVVKPIRGQELRQVLLRHSAPDSPHQRHCA